MMLVMWTIFDVVAVCIIVYVLSVIIASIIPQNASAPIGEHVIYIRSNGLHLEFVIPYEYELYSWEPFIQAENRPPDSIRYVTFGMGDKEFYLNTPEWKDAKFSTVFKALFLPTDSVLRVKFIESDIEDNSDTAILLLTKEQYLSLQSNIRSKFVLKNNMPVKLHGAASNENQLFFEAKGKYSMFNTCNTWINNTLLKSNIRACLWTTFDKPILWQERFVLNKNLRVD